MSSFISYSSRDAAALANVASALRRGRIKAWLDEELTGGEAWWNEILDRIRDCDVFIVALSKNYLDSKPCQAELQYAQALNRPILPVQIGPLDSMRGNPLSSVQTIDYRNPSIDTGIELIAAVHAGIARATPLPSPLPESPPVPFAYLLRLSNTLAAAELSATQQNQVFSDLQAGLETDGDEPSARRDLMQLLIRLRDRKDVTYKTRTDVENYLSSINAEKSPAPPQELQIGPAPVVGYGIAQQNPHQTPPRFNAAPPPPQGGGHGAQYGPPPATARPGKSRKPILIIGGGIAAAVAALALVFVFVRPTSPSSPPTLPEVDSTQLSSILISRERIQTIMNGSNMKPGSVKNDLSEDQAQVAPPTCSGVVFTAQNSIYQASSWSGVAQQDLLQKPSDQKPDLVKLYVQQAAVSFSTVGQADDFFKASAKAWKACSEQSATKTYTDAPQTHWSIKELTAERHQLKIFGMQDASDGWGCQHALSVESNLIVEALACSKHIDDEAGQIADEMIANAPH